MKKLAVAGCVMLAFLVALPAAALIQSTEIFIVSAARGPGANQSVWITTLYIFNPSGESTVVQIYPYERDKNNSSVQPASVSIPAGSLEVLDDVILNQFGHQQWGGAFRLVATKPIAAMAAISNVAPTGLFGQGVPGLPAVFAVNPLFQAPNAQIFSASQNSNWRTNLFAVATDSNGATFNVTIYDKNRVQVASMNGITLLPFEAKYWPLTTFFPGVVDEGFIDIVVTAGAAHFLGSRVNQGTNDPLTLEPTLLAIREPKQ